MKCYKHTKNRFKRFVDSLIHQLLLTDHYGCEKCI